MANSGGAGIDWGAGIRVPTSYAVITIDEVQGLRLVVMMSGPPFSLGTIVRFPYQDIALSSTNQMNADQTQIIKI